MYKSYSSNNNQNASKAPQTQSTGTENTQQSRATVSVQNETQSMQDAMKSQYKWLNAEAPQNVGTGQNAALDRQQMMTGQQIGQSAAGQTPAGQEPAAQIAAGQTAAGQISVGQMPAGQMQVGQMPARYPIGQNEEQLIRFTDFDLLPVMSNVPLTAESIQYLNGFIRTQIGRRVKVEFLVGTNSFIDKEGTLLGVGINYIIINETDTDDITLCDFYNIKFITFYY